MLKQTPLNAKHREANAKLVDFSGWEMPIHYGSQIEEHHAVRRDAGMFDVSHMLPVDIKGEGVRAFLRQLLANNVDKLQTTGKALYSCMLHEGGGVVDDLIVYFMSETWFRLVVNAGCADKDIAWMAAQRDRYAPGLEIIPCRDLAMIAVQGPNAAAKFWQALPGSEGPTRSMRPFTAVVIGSMFVARTGYTGEDGFEIMLPAKAAPYLWQALLEAGVKPCGLGARDTLRLEAGMNLFGQDMDEKVTPLESGLAWTVDLASERDFIGKAALLERPIEKQLVGLVLKDRGVLRGHQRVFMAQGAGEVTSGTFSPTLNGAIALARVPAGVKVGDTVEVAIRDKQLQARVVKYPFVRNGKALIDL
ncbi:MAG: glycine cleavage system protein T [Hydrogenophilales bacterium CG03_land_8_20_14_0_80_62_28]|nr:glycine cleavage system aminomethyltransferase GcvT [Betaproteobacteria bacterium]OIO78836.1 MAG: glycine cleavage system protein T [Hydrogenophilaceae bacterium CG1_02_62_390]PIV23724.1 MAG: glycine cleavage system protein T [Hydrogenophilales bacterium CG03_land_8_20_14_0_80_62_28]PIW38604.1 MAG: glycine cleavage system protein T [Hydrogenophilales bacterium CG15_BIG_FIL_POST_REV_8_21_14_020_62_31]PIW71438.1 MAG: glycine cleavage system protein T [Hydrogenophilales bacterium CG12_big_fil_r